MNSETGVAPELEHSNGSRYHVPIDPLSDSTHATVLRLAGSGKRILELGCSAGHMSQHFRKNDCEVIGIDIDPQAAANASQYCERVIVGDLDSMNFEAELGTDSFDVIVAADVLEHLKDPA